MKIILTAFLLPLIINSCQSGTPKAEAPASVTTSNETKDPVSANAENTGLYPMKPDTIEVQGKFLTGCTMPKMIKIAEHNELSSPWKEVAVNANGEFKYRMYLAEPRRIALRTEKRNSYDFIALTTEPHYDIEVNCATGLEKLELKNPTPENVAYRAFSNANKKFRERFDSTGKQDLTKAEVFTKLKGVINDYQTALSGIISSYPNTFTGTVLCTADKLPEGSLASLDALRKNFLARESFANPQIYNDFLGGRILANYLSICDRSADQYDIFNRMMNIAVKNQDAAKRLQQVAYNVFYNRHEEELLTAYIKWAETNPTLMYNQSVKGVLPRLKKVMAGTQYTEIQLTDINGAPKKLSDAIKSGKLTLLIFYSPTCEHCQAEIPELKPIWDKYKNKGLKVYAVGFDATNDEWKWFINNKASPEWIHVFDQNQNASFQYVVNYTPTFVLIDSQGKIITRMAELDDVKTGIPKMLD